MHVCLWRQAFKSPNLNFANTNGERFCQFTHYTIDLIHGLGVMTDQPHLLPGTGTLSVSRGS